MLEELTLQGSYRINDDSLIKFAESHPFLKKLELWWLNRLTVRFTNSLANACPGLRELHIVMCTQLDDESMFTFILFFILFFHLFINFNDSG